MKLTIKDRVIILNTILPGYATRSDIKGLVVPITEKIKLLGDDLKELQISSAGENASNVAYTEKALEEAEYDITSQELEYLKKRIDIIDQNGMFSISTIETYDKILNEKIISES